MFSSLPIYDWKLYIYLDDLRKKIKKAHEDHIASACSLNDYDISDGQYEVDEEITSAR